MPFVVAIIVTYVISIIIADLLFRYYKITLEKAKQKYHFLLNEHICEKCGNKYSLYLCDNLNDIYIYADSFLDERYFDYSK